ncbi:PstS family phosphate ABC transporter substrate-binding protein [Pseudobacteriovorax antillogorgiicola]|uniref:Phosphate ABC transporter substrate-binding protein, PhoT family n=1 Tax=Pseudobacteriovorax antillogorgiicola TaxID=1513793 RepID=A0A1Y6CM39_9BACT|nr:PstS family phosphate ABC transporter substrate-binding protein [Pseudobacteriovorax antillogorgiicola]TCS47255.1 phosphate ABC transporter substrate-binding protein (PhoT family) [Pseudobacteriovorax antillogorgiicola]SMF62072.1 phosphate ABC transporter substrate-binding protein, PhoT family [Pseudobacteriovorax antillogorgiicola]
MSMKVVFSVVTVMFAFPLYGISIGGSTTVHPAIAAVSTQYQIEYPDRRIDHSQSSSTRGIQQLMNGELDLAAASRPLKVSEVEKMAEREVTIKSFHVAYDAICVIVHRDNPVDFLDQESLQKIFFDGDATHWSKWVPTFREPVMPFGRRGSTSGTSEIFKQVVSHNKGKSFGNNTALADSHEANIHSVEQNRGAISFVPLSLVSKGVRAIALKFGDDKPQDCHENQIRTQSYPMSRSLYLIAHYPPSKPVAQFMLYFLSKEGQKKVAASRLLPVRIGI